MILALFLVLTPASSEGCGAERLQEWVGQPEAALDMPNLPENTRLIRPGDLVTQDFQPGRLNVLVDADGNVQRVYCG